MTKEKNVKKGKRITKSQMIRKDNKFLCVLDKFLGVLGKLGYYAKYNIQFISYTFLCLVSCILAKVFTIGGFNFKGNFFDLAIIILLGSLAYFIKPKKQFYYFFGIMMAITILNIINVFYYAFFTNFVSVSLLSTLFQASEQGGAILEKLNPFHFIYIIMPIIFFFIHRVLVRKDYFNVVEKIEVGKKLFINVAIVGGICLFINIAMLTGSDLSRFAKQWNREYIVERFGMIIYQGNDLVQTINTNLNSLFGYEEAAENFAKYYTNREVDTTPNKYTNMFEGSNVVVIHLESIMNFLIGLEINGQEVTPNLNKLVKESMYFDNFYSQVSVGTSSDAEFTFSSSLLPVQSGTVAVSYADRKYETLQSLLADNKYYTFSMHGNKASMWNRSKLHKALGYKDFYSQEYYEMDEIVGLGLSDHSFFIQSENFIKEIKEMVESKDKYNNFMGTMIMLSNHTPFEDPKYTEGPDAFDVTYHTGKFDDAGNEIVYDYLKDEMIGRYIQSVHYADKCLGELIEYAKTHEEFENTLFVMYGDHAAQLRKNQFNYFVNYDFERGEVREEGDPGYINYDYYENELFKKVPLIIWSTDEAKNKKITKKVSYTMGMIDVMPTVTNMLGIKTNYALGHDIFNIKNDNIVVFPNGNFLTKKVYYYNSKNEFRILGTDVTIDDSYIDERKQYAEEILDLSNDIIVHNLLDSATDRIGKPEYIKEELKVNN